MLKVRILIILVLFGKNLFSAAGSCRQVDERIMPVTFSNITRFGIAAVYARTDPLNCLLPISQEIIPSDKRKVLQLSSLSLLLLIQELNCMLRVTIPQSLKERYFGIKARGGGAGVLIEPAYDEVGRETLKFFRISAYLTLRDERYEIISGDYAVARLASCDQIQDEIVDASKGHLPSSEGLYMLCKRKYLRRSIS